MKKILLLSKPYKVALLTFLVSLLGFAATAFLFPTKMDIPLGILLGGIIFPLLNVLQGLAEKRDVEKAGTTFSLIVIIFKFLVVVTLLIISALMFYKWNLPYFNIFCLVGTYTVSLLATILVYLIDKE